MKNIEVKILNPLVLAEAEKMMVCSARLTQKGHKIKNMDDFMELYSKNYTEKTAQTMVTLPHPTIQKFGAVNIVVVGASRRFLAQITRHQNEVKFMSASLQYSDYTGEADFVVPYEVLEQGESAINSYLSTCQDTMERYKRAIEAGVDNDAAGYMAPQGLANVLIISATPYQLAHMIQQRTCRRNTSETRYVMLKIWDLLEQYCPNMFGVNAGPFCLAVGSCPEGHMACGKPIPDTPMIVGATYAASIINKDFPLLVTADEKQ